MTLKTAVMAIAVLIVSVASTAAQQSAQVTVTGTLTREGVECPAMRGDNGSLYTLTGNIDRFQPGDRVKVTGTLPQVSYCQQGTTIQVGSIGPG